MTRTKIDSVLTGDGSLAPVVLSGADVVSIGRINKLLDEFGTSFKQRSFTKCERSYCDDQADPPQHYAARWAAKEAFLKTLDDSRPAVRLDEICIKRYPSGPTLSVSNEAESALSDALSTRGSSLSHATVSVSISHDRHANCAFATVVVAAETGND